MENVSHPTPETAHLFLQRCSYIFNDGELLRKSCYYHRYNHLFDYLSEKFSQASQLAPENTPDLNLEIAAPLTLVKLLSLYKKLFEPIHVWILAGYSREDFAFFLENLPSARGKYGELLRSEATNDDLQNWQKERLRKDLIDHKTRKFRRRYRSDEV